VGRAGRCEGRGLVDLSEFLSRSGVSSRHSFVTGSVPDRRLSPGWTRSHSLPSRERNEEESMHEPGSVIARARWVVGGRGRPGVGDLASARLRAHRAWRACSYPVWSPCGGAEPRDRRVAREHMVVPGALVGSTVAPSRRAEWPDFECKFVTVFARAVSTGWDRDATCVNHSAGSSAQSSAEEEIETLMSRLRGRTRYS